MPFRRRRRDGRGCSSRSENNQCSCAADDAGKAAVTRLANDADSYYKFDGFLVFFTSCGIFMSAPLYGFNVFVLPLLRQFSGTDATTTRLTMSDGAPVYAAGTALLFCTVGNFFVAPRMDAVGYGNVLGVGLCISAIGLVLSFVAVQYSILWLFYVGYGVIFGFGTGWINIPLLTNMVLWFRSRHNKPGLASGVFGFSGGLWPAAFSYFGVALQNSVGISYTFLVLALLVVGLGSWVAWFVYPPGTIHVSGKQEEVNTANIASTECAEEVPSPSNDDPLPEKNVNDSPPNARADNALSGSDLVRTPQFWLIMVSYFLALLPGFGVKLVISPLMKGVFDASESTQSAVSSMFLASYAVGRLAFGPLVDRYDAKNLLLGCFAVQSLVCIALGAIIWYAAEGKTGIWSFAVVNMVLGLGLAASKAIYSVFVLTIFGAPSLGAAMGRLFVGLGASALAGPVAMWSVLVSASESLNGDSNENNSTTFTRSVSLFFWMSTVGTLVSIGLLFAVKPHEFQASEEDASRASFSASSSNDSEAATTRDVGA